MRILERGIKNRIIEDGKKSWESGKGKDTVFEREGERGLWREEERL